MPINQNQIRDLTIATATAAASVGRPNEIAYIASLGGFFKYVVDSTLTNNATTIMAANGTNAHWVMIANYTPGVKNNFNATAAPTASDDSTTGYSVGSMWVDIGADTTYICVDSTATAAIWNSNTVPAAVPTSAVQVGPSADVTLSFATGTHFNFDTVFYTRGTELSLVTGAQNTGGKITGLKAGKTYRLSAYITSNPPSVGSVTLAFKDLTNNAQIGASFQSISTSMNTVTASGGSQIAFITPSIDIEVGIDALSGTINTVGVDSTFTVEEVATQTVTNISVKNNLAGTTSPVSTDDVSAGYVVGSTWIDTTADKTYICVDNTAASAIWNQIDSVSTPSTLTETNIAQTAHGLAALDAVRFDGTNWVKAIANADGSGAAQAIVSSVIDANTFDVVTKGVFTITGHGLTVANYYWLDQTTAGAIVSTAPTSGTAQSVLFVRDANTISVNIEQPTAVSAGPPPAPSSKGFIQLSVSYLSGTITAVGVMPGSWSQVTTSGISNSIVQPTAGLPMVTLKAGKMYYLTAHLRYTGLGVNDYVYASFQIVSSSTNIGIPGVTHSTSSTASFNDNSSLVEAYYLPTADTNVRLAVSGFGNAGSPLIVDSSASGVFIREL